jgi:hypothetical protein
MWSPLLIFHFPIICNHLRSSGASRAAILLACRSCVGLALVIRTTPSTIPVAAGNRQEALAASGCQSRRLINGAAFDRLGSKYDAGEQYADNDVLLIGSSRLGLEAKGSQEKQVRYDDDWVAHVFSPSGQTIGGYGRQH